jgi:hypothetical protein
MVDTPKVVALTPLYAQGETEDRPKPIPNISRINAKAAAAVAPATMAAHDTALEVCIGSRYSLSAEIFGRAMMSHHKVKFEKL